MDDIFVRTKKLIGDTAFSKLSNTTIILFGLGGVGGFILESLARSGIENFILIDFDKIETSNLNRQIITNLNNISMGKADAAKSRVLGINKDCNVISINAKVVPNKLDNETDKIISEEYSSSLNNDIDVSSILSPEENKEFKKIQSSKNKDMLKKNHGCQNIVNNLNKLKNLVDHTNR